MSYHQMSKPVLYYEQLENQFQEVERSEYLRHQKRKEWYKLEMKDLETLKQNDNFINRLYLHKRL